MFDMSRELELFWNAGVGDNAAAGSLWPHNGGSQTMTPRMPVDEWDCTLRDNEQCAAS